MVSVIGIIINAVLRIIIIATIDVAVIIINSKSPTQLRPFVGMIIIINGDKANDSIISYFVGNDIVVVDVIVKQKQ